MSRTVAEVYRWAIGQYPGGMLQDMIVVLREIEKSGGSVADFIALAEQHYLERRMLALEEMKRLAAMSADYRMVAPRCPECGSRMGLYRVNSVAGNQVGGPWKSMWQCADLMGCGYEEFSERDYEEEYREKFGQSRLLMDRLDHEMRNRRDGAAAGIVGSAARHGPRATRHRRCAPKRSSP